MRIGAGLLLLVAGCGSGSPDRERAGDVAWHTGRWADAMVDYRAAGDAPRLTAKLADAALQAGALAESAAAWTKLGIDDPQRAGEAAAGLARLADLAERDGKPGALVAAVLGIRRVAPSWPAGRLAGRLGPIAGMTAPDIAVFVPALLAATADRAAADPLLFSLAVAHRARGACDAAVPVLEGVLRRTVNSPLRDSVVTTLGWCELGLGLAALQADRSGDAERWLDRAATRDSLGAVGRRALVGFGDARARQGDSTAAKVAWRTVAAAGAAPDTLTQLALLRLAQIAPVLSSDTTPLHPVRP